MKAVASPKPGGTPPGGVMMLKVSDECPFCFHRVGTHGTDGCEEDGPRVCGCKKSDADLGSAYVLLDGAACDRFETDVGRLYPGAALTCAVCGCEEQNHEPLSFTNEVGKA